LSWYCDLAPGHPFHGPYHEREYGFPLTGEDALFERLALEINQAGLSWLLVLKRREALRRAFDNFQVDKVARYGPPTVGRLLKDPGIIRNRRKVEAVIENARRIRELRGRFGSFAAWIDGHHPRSKDSWVRLFRETFVFTGGEVTGEFLMSIGYLPGAHRRDCPVFAVVAELEPAWMRGQNGQAKAPGQKPKQACPGNKITKKLRTRRKSGTRRK
jgi:DNA-3-methyladenine glycosylase I